MSFLSPLAFLLAGLSVPLLLLYFLKVRRREMTVSSLLLWDPALRDREASTFFQRLQRDPLLILQILALLALTAALARPAITVMGQGNKRVVVVMDSSASMKATDVGPSRFVQAQREALGLLGRLGEGAEVMVIEAGVQPRVVMPFTRKHDEVSSAIRALESHDLPNRLGEGIRTARALVGTDPRAEIHVFTDGAHPAAIQSQGDDVRIRWVGVGRRSNNVGITGLSVRRNYFGTFNSQAFMSMANFSPEPQTFSLTLTLDGETLAEKTLTLEPEVRRAVVVPFTDPGGGVVRLRLNVSDDLASDNVAYAVLPPQRQIVVTLVSPGNLFLEKALKTDPQVKLEVKKPEEYQGGMEGSDVVVIDSASPSRVGNGRFVLVNAVPPDVPLEVLGRLENPVIIDWDRTHPIMRQLDFAKITIEDALRVRPLAAGKTLVEATGGPLIYTLEERDRKAVFFGFDLFKTDFPLRVAFPLMLSKSLRWLHPAGLDQSSLSLTTGQPILLPVEHGVTTATVTTPSGRRVKAQVTRGVASFAETDEVGVYTVSTSRGETRVAVNLMSAEESELTPRPLPAFVEAARPEAAPVPIQRELWPFFVLLALVLFAVEGLLYWRRQTGGRFALPYGFGDRWALGLRCALMAVLVIALFKPTIPRWIDRLNVVFLLDMSDSVSLASRENAYRFASQAVAAIQPGDQAGVIVFGEEAVVDQPLRASNKIDRPQAKVSGRGTNLAQALQLAMASSPAGQANRFVLLTDGRQNAGNALAVAQAAKDAGSDIYYVPAPLTFTQEVVVESMVLPQEVKFGEPFQAKVVAWSQAETQGRLAMFKNGEFLGSQVVKLNPGKNVYTYRQSLEQSGIHVYQAAIEVDGDTIEENNRAVGTVVVRGRPQVLLAEKNRDQAQALAAALRSQHVDVTVVEPDKIPKDMPGLAEIRRDRPVQRVVAQDDEEADGDHPRLRPRAGRRSRHDRRRGKLRPRRVLPHAHRGSAARDHGGEAEARDPEPGRRVVDRPLGLDGDDHRRRESDQARHREGGVSSRHRPPRRAQRGGCDELGYRVHLGRAGASGPRQTGHPSSHLDDQGRRRDRRVSGVEGGVPGSLRPTRSAQARHLPLRRPDDARGFLGPAPAHGQGQDHRVDGGDRQGRRRAADGGYRQVGAWTLLLHRGRCDHPTHLHARDPARVQGVAGRAALQAGACEPGPRGHSGHRLERIPAPRRLRRDDDQGHRGPRAHDAPGRSAARDLALRSRPIRRLHVGRQGEVGRALGALGQLQQVLVAGDALDASHGHPERHGGLRLPDR